MRSFGEVKINVVQSSTMVGVMRNENMIPKACESHQEIVAGGNKEDPHQ